MAWWRGGVVGISGVKGDGVASMTHVAVDRALWVGLRTGQRLGARMVSVQRLAFGR